MAPHVGDFEQLVLLAILKLDEAATGAAIRETVEDASRKRVWIGAVYTALQRLEAKGLIRAGLAAPAGAGERRLKIFALSAQGRNVVGQTYDTWTRITRGLKPKLESLP